MKLTEEIKKEIREYVEEKGWVNNYLFSSNMLHSSYFKHSPKGLKENLIHKWKENEEKMDKYLLEYIGFILRKYNITKINIIDGSTNQSILYYSTDWKFNNIKKIL